MRRGLSLRSSTAYLDSLVLVMTYSILAPDPVTGQLGVAVQSHAFSVGPTLYYAKDGTPFR